jgi:hypothetical protein
MPVKNTRFVVMLFFIISIWIKDSYAMKDQFSPILVLAKQENFGLFTGEMLKAEGFNEFQMDSLSGINVSLKYLKKFDIVILAETALSAAQQKMLTGYVKWGGNLIAFKPDKKLNKVFGIAIAGNTIGEGYVSFNTNTTIGRGLTKERLQFHGTASSFILNGAEKIASLFEHASTPTEFPAVVSNNYGKGHAIAFLYNLPESIVYTRQGNYRYAGLEKDGITGIRAMDMFTEGWVDTSKNTINQADEQMRLLSHCIEYMSGYTKPLPRFWYFPDTLKCLVTLTNDGEDSNEEEFTPQFSDIDSLGAKMSLYIKETDLVSKEWVAAWSNRGFEMAGHFDDTRQAQNPDWKIMDSVIKDLKNRLNNKYGIDKINTVVNHWFVWCGKDADNTANFAAQAKLEAAHGIGMDINYAHYDNYSNQGHFLGAMGASQGNYTGSGLVMKFANKDGAVLNIYQHFNSVYDQQYMEHNDSTGFYNCFKGLLDRSLNNEVYSYISIKAHNDEYFFSKTPLRKMLDYAKDNDIPVWAPVTLLEFLKAKDEAGFSNIQWSNNRLSFTIKSSLTHNNGLTCMIPYNYNKKTIDKITVNGITKSYTVKSVKGAEYAWITIQPGFVYHFEIDYTN